MQLKEIFTIWDRFENSAATEITLETKEGKLCLKKGGAASEGRAAAPVFSTQGSNSPASEGMQELDDAAESSELFAASGEIVKAPFVGTFYRASAPGAEPYIKIGQSVKKGDVIGVIEAMKLMNEITSPCDGVVAEIYIEDETLVEFGQALVCISES